MHAHEYVMGTYVRELRGFKNYLGDNLGKNNSCDDCKNYLQIYILSNIVNFQTLTHELYIYKIAFLYKTVTCVQLCYARTSTRSKAM